MLKGTGASPGYGIGRVFLLKNQKTERVLSDYKNSEAELERYRAAVGQFREKTLAQAKRMEKLTGKKEAEILRGHVLMLEDPYVSGEIEKLIASLKSAECAVETVYDRFVSAFSAAGDEFTSQRAVDVSDVKEGLLRLLSGEAEADLSALPPGTVLVVRELTPSMTAEIQKENICGIVTQTGGMTSHSAILARALEIPAVLSVENVTELAENGKEVIVDGLKGEVLLDPDSDTLSLYRGKRKEFLNEQKELKKFIGKKTQTADGEFLELAANIGSIEETYNALEYGAQGIGLFRTELLYLERSSLPDEEEQFKLYRQAVLAMRGKPVIIRTLDIGGDKKMPALNLEREENPFLGWRAIRLCLGREELFRTQLKALLRASAYGELRIMLPFITCAEELREAKKILKELKEELNTQKTKFDAQIKLGVMIETPAAVLISDLLAQEADFFSIGTNDLTQYVMAADRGNARVSYLYSPYYPAVLRAIRKTAESAVKGGIPVGMCGEAAADPLLLPLLISFGLSELSVSPNLIPAVRRGISRWSRKEADSLCQRALSLSTEEEVRTLLKKERRG